MNKKTKSFLVIAGGISLVLGAIWTFPSYIKGIIWLGVVSTILIIAGFVMLGLAFGD